MKIPVMIVIDDSDTSVCGDGCPFSKYDHCVLFDEPLEDTVLHPLLRWNDCSPTKQRCRACTSLEDE